MRDGAGTKTKIQEVALRLFVDKGVAETTVRDLAAAGGIAEGTLYRHYESKDELITDLFVTNYAAFARRLSALLADKPDFRARLGAITQTFVTFFDENPILFRFLWLAQHHGLVRISKDDDNPVEIVNRTIQRAIAKREITATDANLATAFVLGILLQPALALVYGRIAAPLGSYADTLTETCWRALNP